MIDFDYEQAWPSPSSRWKSFEAEAFPVRAYRFDVRHPYEVAEIGVHKLGEYQSKINTLKLFGPDTVFSSASKIGVKNYIDIDTSRYQNLNRQLKNRIISRDIGIRESIFHDEGENGFFSKPYLYRIKTDTHNSISFKDLHKEFEANFTSYAGGEIRRKPLVEKSANGQGIANSDEIISNINMVRKKFPETFNKIDKKLSSFDNNDEIHINKSTINAGIRNSYSSRMYYESAVPHTEFVQVDALDLAIFVR
ncbi:hypothetical protein U2P60_10475 [Brucella sp. H1_1004]|uniref:hypothetical protein n=1 Tax=Brucella sp. H1_1004 TaxID=3110109 RepID=UPI0039B5F3A9